MSNRDRRGINGSGASDEMLAEPRPEMLASAATSAVAGGDVSADRRWTRRTFLTRAALLAAAAHIPLAFGGRALVDPARAMELDLTTDTFNGLMAFVAPGDDAYSIAQGVSRPGQGGVGAGAV